MIHKCHSNAFYYPNMSFYLYACLKKGGQQLPISIQIQSHGQQQLAIFDIARAMGEQVCEGDR